MPRLYPLIALPLLLASCAGPTTELEISEGPSTTQEAAQDSPSAPALDCATVEPRAVGVVSAIDPTQVLVPGGVLLSQVPDCAFSLDHPNDVYDSIQVYWEDKDESWIAESLPLFQAAGYDDTVNFGPRGGTLGNSALQVTITFDITSINGRDFGVMAVPVP